MFNLTRQERQAILFVSIVALAGVSISFLTKKSASVRTVFTLAQSFGKVDINSADKNSLMSVSGIGEKLAQRIIDYRRDNPKFCSIEELKKVKGITDYRYTKIKDSLVVK